jgi:hypothetical protein
LNRNDPTTTLDVAWPRIVTTETSTANTIDETMMKADGSKRYCDGFGENRSFELLARKKSTATTASPTDEREKSTTTTASTMGEHGKLTANVTNVTSGISDRPLTQRICLHRIAIGRRSETNCDGSCPRKRTVRRRPPERT